MGIAETPEMPGEESVRAVLRNVIDPEAGMNVVDLGLIYGIDIEPGSIRVTMTMTTPACPMSAMIMEEAYQEIREIAPAAAEIDVQLVWDPPWDASMLSEYAKDHFGW
jgi:metal-sulfur cluster biosynthetic enzyme